MTKLNESIGVKLNLEGLKKIRKDLTEVGNRLSETGRKASEPFRKSSNRIKRAFVGVTAAATTMSRAIIAGATRAAASLVRISAAATRMAAAVAASGAKAGAALGRGIAAGVKTATASIAKITAAAAGAVAAAGIGTTSDAREIQTQSRLAKTAGTTTEKFSALAAVTKQLGLEQEDLQGAMSDLSEKMYEAAVTGDETLLKLFNDVGLSITDSNGQLRDTADVFAEIPDALRRIPSQAQRSALATKLIAGDSEKLAGVLALTNAELTERIKLAKDTGQIVTDKQARAAEQYLLTWERFKGTIVGLWREISTRLYPVFERMFKVLGDGLRENRKLIADKFVGAVSALVNGFTKLVAAVFEINGAVADTDTGFGAFVDLIQAAARGAGLLIKSFSGVGSSIANSLGAGIKAIRDFSFGLLLANGQEETAGQLFGRRITNSDPARTRGGFRDGRRVDLGAEQSVTSGYGIDFDPNEDTLNAATGLSEGIRGVIDRFSTITEYLKDVLQPALVGAWDTLLLKLGEVQTFIFSSAIPFAKDLGFAFLDAFNTQIERLKNLYQEWEFLQDLWLVMSGRSADVKDDSVMGWMLIQAGLITEAFQDLKRIAGELWTTLAPLRERIDGLITTLFGTDNPYAKAVLSFFLYRGLKSILSFGGAIIRFVPALVAAITTIGTTLVSAFGSIGAAATAMGGLFTAATLPLTGLIAGLTWIVLNIEKVENALRNLFSNAPGFVQDFNPAFARTADEITSRNIDPNRGRTAGDDLFEDQALDDASYAERRRYRRQVKAGGPRIGLQYRSMEEVFAAAESGVTSAINGSLQLNPSSSVSRRVAVDFNMNGQSMGSLEGAPAEVDALLKAFGAAADQHARTALTR